MDKTIKIIPQELEGATKLGKYFFFSDVAFIVIFFSIMSYFEGLVREDLVMFYYIFNIIIGIILIVPSIANPRRRMWTTFLFSIYKDNNVYENISYKTEEAPIQYLNEKMELKESWKKAVAIKEANYRQVRNEEYYE